MSWSRRAARRLVIPYAVILLLTVLTPVGWWLNRLTVWLWVLFHYRLHVLGPEVGPEHYGLLLNVLLFLPLGWLAGVLLQWRWWQVVAGATSCSVAIEVMQMVVSREPSWGDIVSNVLGAALGLVVARVRRPHAPR